MLKLRNLKRRCLEQIVWELHELIHKRSEKMGAIKKINGSLLISPWKRKKQKTLSNLILKILCQRSLSRGIARTFQRRGEGHTESNRGYSPDCHVDLHAVLKKGFQRGGVWSRAPQDPLPPIYVLAFHMWVYSCEKLGLRRG